MSAVENGGPAFPVVLGVVRHEGMSLRDHFAGLAMPEAIKRTESEEGCALEWWSDEPASSCDVVAGMWYRMADAKLKARSP